MLNGKPKLQQLTIKPFKRCECEMRPFEEWMNQMNISKTAAMYIVEKDVKSGITTWMYIPEEKKEKKMKETNLPIVAVKPLALAMGDIRQIIQ